MKIPDFKTYLKESHWSEMNRRSQGTTVRKEDDIDLLDREGLCNYFINHYEILIPNIIINNYVFDRVNIPIFYNDGYNYIIRDFETDEIYVDRKLANNYALKSFFKQNYILKKIKTGPIKRFVIENIDKSRINSTFINLLNSILDYTSEDAHSVVRRKDVNESHWSEMNRRSQGIVKRKEDDINLLNREDFTNYLNTIYEFYLEPGLKVLCGSQFITVPLFFYKFLRRSIILDPENGRARLLGALFDKWPDDLKKYINSQYSTEYGKGDYGDYVFFIRPKEGEGDNKFFIKLIDDIIAHVDSPLLRKKVNESHWSEMNRRSQGIKVRKEDDDMERFANYLKAHYKTGESFIEVFTTDDPKYYKNKQYTWLAVPMCDTVDRSLCLVLNEVDGERYITTSNIMLNRFHTNKNKIESVFLVKEERRDYDENAPQKDRDMYWPDEVTSSDNGHSYMRGSPYGSVRLIPKDGSEITNTYFIKVLNFLIDNIDNYDLTIERK